MTMTGHQKLAGHDHTTLLPKPALAPPAEWLGLFFTPLGLPEGIWSCLGNI